MYSLPQQPKPIIIVIVFSLILIFTSSTLVATADPQPPTPDSLSSFPLHPSSFSSLPDGAQIYQQWCSSCHGDQGQGLTAAWRAEWPEGKQNCWQSKCHAGNHPPDGFSFPKNVPALIGQDTLTKFSTAQDLYAYARAAMPYWSPNSLSDDEYQAITIFLVEANYAKRGLSRPDSLSRGLVTVSLHPETKGVETSLPPTETSPKIEQTFSETPNPVISSTPNRPPSTPVTATFFGLPLLWITLIVLSGILIVFLARPFFFRSH